MTEKSEHAKCAQHIRNDLKKAFPGIKFRVASEIYSMGTSVLVEWVNGPTIQIIESIIKKYQYGHFNGIEDIYEHSNERDNIPQVKFVSCQREVSVGVDMEYARCRLSWV